jgi:hypothetical protein
VYTVCKCSIEYMYLNFLYTENRGFVNMYVCICIHVRMYVCRVKKTKMHKPVMHVYMFMNV